MSMSKDGTNKLVSQLAHPDDPYGVGGALSGNEGRDVTSTATPGAGRELDALVAEKVFEWGYYQIHDSEGGYRRGLPGYSWEIAAALTVIDWLMERVFGVSLNCNHESGWTCFIQFTEPPICVSDETAPLAICKAALAYAESRGPAPQTE